MNDNWGSCRVTLHIREIARNEVAVGDSVVDNIAAGGYRFPKENWMPVYMDV